MNSSLENKSNQSPLKEWKMIVYLTNSLVLRKKSHSIFAAVVYHILKPVRFSKKCVIKINFLESSLGYIGRD